MTLTLHPRQRQRRASVSTGITLYALLAEVCRHLMYFLYASPVQLFMALEVTRSEASRDDEREVRGGGVDVQWPHGMISRR